MSFVKTAFPITFNEPGDLSSGFMSVAEGVVIRHGTLFKIAATNQFFTIYNYPTRIKNGTAQAIIGSIGDIDFDSIREFRLNTASALKLSLSNGLKINMTAAFPYISFEGATQVRTYPAGTGSYMWADGFTEYSAKANKTDIIDAPMLPLPKPKKYKVAGKEKYGFLADEMPLVLRQEHANEDGTTDLGIDIMGVIAQQQVLVNELTARVTDLEKRVAK